MIDKEEMVISSHKNNYFLSFLCGLMYNQYYQCSTKEIGVMKQNGFGIAALVFGIIGLLLSFVGIGIIPAIVGFIFAIIGLTRKDRKHGTSIAGLVCSTIGIAVFILIMFFVVGTDNNESSVTSSIDSTTNETEKSEVEKSNNDLASQMSVEEYSYENSIGDTLYFLVVKNNSSETVEINVNAIAKDADGNTIGATDSSENAVASGEEVCLCNYFDTVSNADKFEYTMTVKKDLYYQSVMNDISVEESKTDEKVILTCTNNGTDAAQFVKAYALFFKDGTLINYDSTYVCDSDSEIKPGAAISSELICYGGYDDVKVYLNGRK